MPLGNAPRYLTRMSNHYKTKQIGDILRLPMPVFGYDFPVEAGGYVLLSVGDTCCLAQVSESADGVLCATSTLVYVDMADLRWFVKTKFRMDPLG